MESNVSTGVAALFSTTLIEHGFSGEFHLDDATRLINASDNSIYEVLPLAIAQPRNARDLQLLLQLANKESFKTLHFCVRGGGTGTNGQSLTDGVVIDVSRFMTRIVDFNPAEQSITVEPGVILSDLNRYLLPHGLFYAPHVSTGDRATIGGMIATDAAGKGSLIYGKTSDNLLGLQLILADGQVIDTLKTSTEKGQKSAVLEELERNICAFLAPVQAEIATRFPSLKRPLSGYNIRQCYQNGIFDLNYLIAGSEGTLGVVAAARLKLLPIPKYKALLVVHYSNFLAALEDASFLIQFQPLAIEAIDEHVQNSAQTLPEWPIFANWLNSVGRSCISNFVEFVADTQQQLDDKILAITAALSARGTHFVTITDRNQMNQLWSIRSLAVGLAGKMPGRAKPVAFIEDAIVPPEHLASFVADLQQALDKRQLKYAMYGHVDVGCIHVRPALDMQQEQDRQKIRPITELVIDLLKNYQGILWGEHGKGYRGEFVPDVFGPILYPILCQIKQLFDPYNRLNPGKLTSPDATPLTRIELVPMRGQLDEMIEASEQYRYAGAMLCNGNAACFNQETANVMCPSYKATKDRIHSPKGRAMLVKQWLREKAKHNGKDAEAAEMALKALSTCLGCKGCTGKCPTQVSIPDVRTRFLGEYHRYYKRRSIRDLLLGQIERIVLLAAQMPRVWNFVQQNRLVPRFGFVNAPLFKKPYVLRHTLKRLNVALYSHSQQIKEFPARTVVIFADVFSGLLEQKVLIATLFVLRALEYHVAVIYPRVSGKALITGGFIDQFKANSHQLARLLNPLFAAAIPVVALENTISLMLRDEVNTFATPLNGQVLTLAELLQQALMTQGVIKSVNHTSHYRLLPHCTEQAVLPSEALTWQTIFTLFGAQLEIKNAGCCGMAGAYGHLQEQQQNSAYLFQTHWEPLLDDAVVLATGFSCRSQAEAHSGRMLMHPIELIGQWITDFKMERMTYEQ